MVVLKAWAKIRLGIDCMLEKHAALFDEQDSWSCSLPLVSQAFQHTLNMPKLQTQQSSSTTSHRRRKVSEVGSAKFNANTLE